MRLCKYWKKLLSYSYNEKEKSICSQGGGLKVGTRSVSKQT